MGFKDLISDSLTLSDFSDYEGTMSRAIKRIFTSAITGGGGFLLTGLVAGFTNPISLVFLAIPISASVWSGYDIVYSSISKAGNGINNSFKGGADVVKYEKIAQMERFENKLKPKFVSGLDSGLYVSVEELSSSSGAKLPIFANLVRKLAKEHKNGSDVLVEFKNKLWLEPEFASTCLTHGMNEGIISDIRGANWLKNSAIDYWKNLNKEIKQKVGADEVSIKKNNL